jgi:hypothetical protein
MKYFFLGLTLFLACSYGSHGFAQTKGEGWKLYYLDESGDRYYYDKGSVETPAKGAVIVWQKITEISTGEEADKSTTHLQLNCRQRTYNILSEAGRDRADKKTADEQKGSSPKGGLRADSRLRALFENVCPF